MSTKARRSRSTPAATSRSAIVAAVSPGSTMNGTSVVAWPAGSVSAEPRSSRTMSATNPIPSALGFSPARPTTTPLTSGRATVTSRASTRPAATRRKSRNRSDPSPLPPPRPLASSEADNVPERGTVPPAGRVRRDPLTASPSRCAIAGGSGAAPRSSRGLPPPRIVMQGPRWDAGLWLEARAPGARGRRTAPETPQAYSTRRMLPV